MLGRKRLCLLLFGLFVASCGDRPTAPAVSPGAVPPAPVAAPPPASGMVGSTLDCTVEVASGEMTCGAPAPGGLRAQSGPITVGGQGTYVTLAGTGTYNAGTGIFTVPVTVRNLIPQALGTTDGTTADASGVRVFFIRITPVGGAMSVANRDGQGTFTAAGQDYFQYAGLLQQGVTSAAKTWQLNMASTVTSFTLRVGVWAQVKYRNGWIDLSPTSPTLPVGSTVTLTPTKRDVVGSDSGSANVSWGTSDGTKATVNGSGVVTGVAAGTAVITASSTINGQPISGSTTVTVAAPPVAHDETYPQTVIGHVPINSARIPYSVTSNDAGAPFTVAGYGWNAALDDHLTSAGGTVVMTTSGADIGKFSYTPPVGFTGTDQFRYKIQNLVGSSTATVSLTVSGVVWFINANAATNGDGRLGTPFNNLASFASINDGLGSHPAAGDFVFLYGSASNYTGALTLLGTQRLIGQNASQQLVALLGLPALPSGSDALPSMASSPVARMTGALTLGSGNSLVGLTLGPVTGSGFGALAVADAKIDAGGAKALDLSTGSASGSFISINSTGGVNGILLSGVSGTLAVTGVGTTAGSGGTLSGHTGVSVSVTNSSVSLSRVSIANINANGLSFTGPGTVSIASSSFSSTANRGGVLVTGGSGTTTFNLTGSRLTNAFSSQGNPVNFLQTAAGSLANATLTYDTITVSGTDAIWVEPAAGTMRVRVEQDTANAGSLITAVPHSGTDVSVTVKNNGVSYTGYGVGMGTNGTMCVAATGNRFWPLPGGDPDIILSGAGGSYGYTGTLRYEGSGTGQVQASAVNAAQTRTAKGAFVEGTVTYIAVGSCALP